MAITLTNLEAISKDLSRKDYYFSDLHLDLETNGGYSRVIEKRIPGNDIVMDYDESAIKNSLRNLFNTRPGQRFLFPEYGLDLNSYLFEAVTPELGQMIGEKIEKSIEDFEPRVKVVRCAVQPMPDDYSYDITVIVEIPVFNSTASINSSLDIRSKSFVFVETSRNI